MIEASRYSIQIRKVAVEGEDFYHAKVKEFPYLNEYAETHTEAYDLIIDALNTSFTLLGNQGKEIPTPIAEIDLEEYSGRVTLRLPKTLHASLSKYAEVEDVSLNQLMVSALSNFNGFEKSQYTALLHNSKILQATAIVRSQTIQRSAKVEVKEHRRRETETWSTWALEA